MARFERGSREARERARRAAQARWGRRSGDRLDPGGIASPKPGDRLSSIEFEAALAREAAQAKVKSGAATPSSSAPAGVSGSLNAPTPPVSVGGPQVFSSGAVVDEFLLPQGSIVDLAAGGEAPGSPRTRDLPAARVPVSPQPTPTMPSATSTSSDVAPAAALLRCNFCGLVLNSVERARHAAHQGWGEHEARRWSLP